MSFGGSLLTNEGLQIDWLTESSAVDPALAQGVPPSQLLCETEMERYAALKTPKRRHDWLLGRWTAKHLLQSVLEAQGKRLPLSALRIEAEPGGAPFFPDYPDYTLSISHAGDTAFCALVRGVRLGADIEQITPRPAVFVEDYFTQNEARQVNEVSSAQRDTLITTMWSAKEAALKALRMGLRADTRAVECRPTLEAWTADQWFPLQVETVAHRLDGVAARLAGWWRMMNGFTLTLAYVMENTPCPKT